MRATSWLHAVLLAALCVVAGGIRPASACSCSYSQTPCETYASTSIVFVGDVLSSEATGSPGGQTNLACRPCSNHPALAKAAAGTRTSPPGHDSKA